MQLSVIICTRNRAEKLERLLQSIADCDRPTTDRQWEAIVVDNGSSDRTCEIATAFQASLPVRIVKEERAGLSHARNCGVEVARGEWLVWTDDDVTVGSNWLIAYFNAIDTYPDAHIFGGPIAVHFEGTPPAWLVRGLAHVRSAYAGLEPGDVGIKLSANSGLPYGANFALRRSTAQQYPFNSRLGRHPDRPTRSNEETSVMRDILHAGGSGHWLPEARVLHHIDSTRQTSAYLRSYYVEAAFMNTLDRSSRMNSLVVAKNLAYALSRVAIVNVNHLAAIASSDDSHRTVRVRATALPWGRAMGYLAMLLHRLRHTQEDCLPL